jgi:hypothetical protein
VDARAGGLACRAPRADLRRARRGRGSGRPGLRPRRALPAAGWDGLRHHRLDHDSVLPRL